MLLGEVLLLDMLLEEILLFDILLVEILLLDMLLEEILLLEEMFLFEEYEEMSLLVGVLWEFMTISRSEVCRGDILLSEG